MNKVLFAVVAVILFSVSTSFALSPVSTFTVDPAAPDAQSSSSVNSYPAMYAPDSLTQTSGPGAGTAAADQGMAAPAQGAVDPGSEKSGQQQMQQGFGGSDLLSQDQLLQDQVMQDPLLMQGLQQTQMQQTPQGQLLPGQLSQGQIPGQPGMQQGVVLQQQQQQDYEETPLQDDEIAAFQDAMAQRGKEAQQMQIEQLKNPELLPGPSGGKKSPQPRRIAPSQIERALNETPVPVERVKPQPAASGRLAQFGYSFFRPGATGFTPVTDIPVGPDYLVGAGDRLVVTIWGTINGTFPVVVDRSGEVVLPKIGAVKVAGVRFGELPDLLNAAVGRIFKNFKLNVAMGRLRSIKVFVVGEVRAPGDYNVNSLSTVLTALAVAGGPTKNGTLRNIQIKRNGKLVETVDLYDFFLNGDKGKDVRLQAGDTILVPVVGPVAGIGGNVRRPAIYELKGEQNLKQLLDLANGINPSGFLQRVQLYRVEAHEKKVVTDFNLDLKGEKGVYEVAKGIPIQDHDVVRVLSIDTLLRGYVRLTGYVLRPGDFALKPGMRVSALLGEDNLLPEYYSGAGEIIRLCPPDQHPEVMFFDLGKALKGDPEANVELKEFDRVKIFSRKEMEETPIVKVRGEVQKPLTSRYFLNMTVKDLVMQAGNLKLTAYLKNAEITRLKRTGDSVTSYTIQVDLGNALKGGTDNIKLEPFDELTVRRIPNWAESTERYVSLKGEFVFPGIYPIHKGERLSSVIARAGGFTDLAYLKGAQFTRELARKLQQQRMDEALAKAQGDIINLQTKAAQTAASAEEVAATKAALDSLMKSVEVLKHKKAEGRVLIKISSLAELKGSLYDVELQGGDQLTVPTDPGGVNVIGDVYNQNTVVSQLDRNVDWYLDQVGGPTGNADLSEVYVVKVDGTVVSQKNSASFLFYNSFWHKNLDSGDTIIVPRQYEKTAWLRDIKDIAQILGNIAVTAGVLIAAGLKF